MVGEKTRATSFSSIDVSAGEAFAGSNAALSARIICDPPCDLSGRTIEIFDGNGASLGIARVVGCDDDFVNLTEEIAIKTPTVAGETIWHAVLAAHETDGIAYSETSSPFTVMVAPHPVYLSVWDVPYALDAGKSATIKVGVKCGAGCDMGGCDVAVLNETGDEVASGKAGVEPWPGTESLHVAEVELAAPQKDGEYSWQVIRISTGDAIDHDESRFAFKLRVMPKPQVTVTIETVAEKTGEPISGANVVMHPYRARTDASGTARLRAAKGDYTIVVSKAKFDPMSASIALNEDFRSKVELVGEEPEFNPDDNY